MTLAMGIMTLDGNGELGRLQTAFPKKPNSGKQIKSIKRLAIQPFFYDLVAGLEDMDAILAGMNFCADQENYNRIITQARLLEQAFFQAGYSCKGEPYRADLAGPNVAQIQGIIDAAEGCVPILQAHGAALQKNMGHTPQGKDVWEQFVFRFGRFNRAITGLGDHIALKQHRREESAHEPVLMCALA